VPVAISTGGGMGAGINPYQKGDCHFIDGKKRNFTEPDYVILSTKS
jgi:hypothetical protein